MPPRAAQTVVASMDVTEFRKALAVFATGVTIVTTTDADGEDVGVTANSFSSVSLEPPMVLWSLSKKSSSLPAFANSRYFAINFLSVRQQALSNRFAKSGSREKFSGLDLERGTGRVPLIRECAARFECEMSFCYEGGDHVIIVGKVSRFERWDRVPLIFQAGQYGIAARTLATEDGNQFRHTEVESPWDKDALSFPLSRVYYQFAHVQTGPLRALGLESRLEFALLAVLLVKDGRTLEDLQRLLLYASQPVTPLLVQNLRARGLLEASSGDGTIRLSAHGRQQVLQAVAAEMAWEADALASLTQGEAMVLKDLLRRVMKATDAIGIPTPWH